MALRPNPLVPAGAVATIDRLLGRMREDWCVIEEPSATRDKGGATISDGYSARASVPCQVVAAGRAAVERLFGGRFGPETDYIVKMPRDTAVSSDERIVVNGKTLQVVSDNDVQSYGFELIVATRATG